MMKSVTSVAPSEYDPFYETYVSRVPEGDIVEVLSGQIADTLRLLGSVPPGLEEYRYGPDKWSVREVVGHMIDTERTLSGATRFTIVWASRKTTFPSRRVGVQGGRNRDQNRDTDRHAEEGSGEG
jgi:hypothetical protein